MKAGDSAIRTVLQDMQYIGRLFLGFDTGTSRGKENNCGFALVDIDGDVHESGVWRLEEKSLIDRLAELRSLSADFIREYRYSIIYTGIEEPWASQQNPQVGLKLAKVWGILAAASWRWEVPVVGIAHTTAKKALTGDAKADKEKVKRYAEILKPDIGQFDESDAIAVALATRGLVIERAMKGIKYAGTIR